MKIDLIINGKNFNETRLCSFLIGIIIGIRILLVIVLGMIPSLLTISLFMLLGVKDVLDKHIKFWVSLTFEGDN